MSKQLPERPDLGQLKKQAKDLLDEVRAGRPAAVARVPREEIKGFALHRAQRVVAREHGFSSWARLKLHVETRELAAVTARLVTAASSGDAAALNTILAERPALGRQTISAAAALGDLEGLRRWIEPKPELAKVKAGVCEAEALAYVCLGRLGGSEADRIACVDFLLAHGADPNADWRESPDQASRLPSLYAAVGWNNYPRLAARLLAAGANPNDGESIYHAAEKNHGECLQALLAGGADLSRRDPKWKNTPLYFLLGWSPEAASAPTARAGIFWLLDHGADPNIASYDRAEVPLHLAIQRAWDLGMIARLLERGADPGARRADGTSAWAFAVRAGREDVMALLRERGARDDATARDKFLGACMRADESAARAVLAADRDVATSLAPADKLIVHDAAKAGRAKAIALMAKLGVDVAVTGEHGETALHVASWHGQVAAVRELIRAGVPLDAVERQFGAAPIGWAAHGSQFCRNPGGDYPAAVRALIEAGAKVPKELTGTAEVMAVIRELRPAKN